MSDARALHMTAGPAGAVVGAAGQGRLAGFAPLALAVVAAGFAVLAGAAFAVARLAVTDVFTGVVCFATLTSPDGFLVAGPRSSNPKHATQQFYLWR